MQNNKLVLQSRELHAQKSIGFQDMLSAQLKYDDYGDLWDGSLLTPLDRDEQGIASARAVWTGTTSDGSREPGATLGHPGGLSVFGATNFQGPLWVSAGIPLTQNIPQSYYAISGVIVAVPEPGSLLLVGIGTSVWGLARLRRKNARGHLQT